MQEQKQISRAITTGLLSTLSIMLVVLAATPPAPLFG